MFLIIIISRLQTTVLISLLLIFSYTYKGGLKTIIITDTLQTFFLVASVFMTIYFICNSLDLSMVGAFEEVKNSNYSKIFFFDDFMGSKFHFVKQILGGMFAHHSHGRFGSRFNAKKPKLLKTLAKPKKTCSVLPRFS